MERYFIEEQRKEEAEEAWAALQIQCTTEVDIRGQVSFEESSTSESSSLELIRQSTSETNNERQSIVDVYVPRCHLVVSMNTRDFSSIIAWELRNIYMECFN